jgi:sulfofructose kinase
MRAPRVVGLGLCVVDHLYLVEGLDLGSGRLRYRERRVANGGMTATALAQAAALGCEAHLLSVVGDDPEGRYLRRALRRLGVRTRRLVLSRRVPTTVAVVLVDARTGERRFVVADRRRIEAEAPPLDLAPITAGSCLLVDGHFPAQAQRAVRRARAVGATVIGDFHRDGPAVRRLLPFVDHAIVPLEFAASRGGDPRRTLRELAALCRGAPVVTLGSRGGIYLDGGRVRRFRAFPARVLDTTGAGDVLHGACAAGLAHGLPLAACLELGARAAARACAALGGTANLLPRAELARLLGRSGAGAGRG